MNGEPRRGVIVSSATHVSACIFRGAFADEQSALSAQGMDAKVFPWFQFHITLKINHFFKKVTHVLYSFSVSFYSADSNLKSNFSP